MGKLDGKVALITGSGRNIGRATALKFAGEGAHVVVNARANQQEAESVAREVRDLGVKSVADPRRCRQQGRGRGAGGEGAVRIRPGRHPGQQRRDPAAQAIHRVTDEDWERVRNVVLDGAFYLTRALIPSMVKNKYGRILFFCGDGSISAQGHGRAHLSAAKMGLIGMARGLASEFAAHNIRVNVVSPGSIDTRRDNPEWYTTSPGSSAERRRHPAGRQGKVDEIAATCLFLVSDDGGFITGQTIHVNGGAHYY